MCAVRISLQNRKADSLVGPCENRRAIDFDVLGDVRVAGQVIIPRSSKAIAVDGRAASLLSYAHLFFNNQSLRTRNSLKFTIFQRVFL